jgi:hypothetical protein
MIFEITEFLELRCRDLERDEIGDDRAYQVRRDRLVFAAQEAMLHGQRCDVSIVLIMAHVAHRPKCLAVDVNDSHPWLDLTDRCG